jgi:glycosyltransferase involved in cell wall biosynthesis
MLFDGRNDLVPTPTRILYCAIDQQVPGSLGGSVHVQAVAEGLAALGHEVHALAGQGDAFPVGAVHWHAMRAPGGRPQLRLLRAGAIARLARLIQPHVVIERYHNFGGEGRGAADAVGARYVLEVNAPVVDHPGSRKALVDRALIVEPMRRWRERLVRRADLIVSPSARILPDWVPRERVLEIEWGADTTRFRPETPGPVPYSRTPGTAVAVFAGAFRAWHGARQFVDAMGLLRAHGQDWLHAVLIGDGPERPAAEQAAQGIPGVTFTGALAHDVMPAALAGADIGVAPFDVARHPPLSLGFYWSPLKIFEYMASGLPVVAPAVPRLGSLIGHGVEGVLYDPATPAALAGALSSLADAHRRTTLGAAARDRAVRDYSWDAHCQALDRAIAALGPGR